MLRALSQPEVAARERLTMMAGRGRHGRRRQTGSLADASGCEKQVDRGSTGRAMALTRHCFGTELALAAGLFKRCLATTGRLAPFRYCMNTGRLAPFRYSVNSGRLALSAIG